MKTGPPEFYIFGLKLAAILSQTGLLNVRFEDRARG
jgi:hypothetical protein